MGYRFRCGGCGLGADGQPGCADDGYPGGTAIVVTSWHDEDAETVWCEDEGRLVLRVPGGEPTGTHAGHEHRAFPRTAEGCTSCPRCGSADVLVAD